MKPREFDPLRLDVAAFAKEGAGLSGTWPLATLPRLAASDHAEPPATAGDAVAWAARGESRPARGAEAETWLHLKVSARLHLECQRCLKPVETLLEIDRPLRFVADETTAAALDAESEDDVLVLSRALDLRELAEDELLLALPLVPRHPRCPEPLAAAGGAEPVEDRAGRPNPFAVLEQLKAPGAKH